MNYNNKLMHKLERKFGRFAIRNLMMYIVIAQGLVFMVNYLMPESLLVWRLMFVMPLIRQGEVWRLISFIFLPTGGNVFFVLISMYFYMLLGSGLEGQWGAFRFNIFYLCGIIGTIIAGTFTWFATNHYLNLSLFLAFAILFPNFEIRLFFILPIKVKWLAAVYTVFLAYSLVINTMAGRIAILVSLINIILFFGKDFISLIKRWNDRRKWKKNFR